MAAHSNQLSFPESLRVYRKLLGLYPASFRARHGAPMEQLFLDQCRDAFQHKAAKARLRFWSRILADTISSLCQSWLSLEGFKDFFYSKAAGFPFVFCAVLGCVFLATAAITALQPVRFYTHISVTAAPRVDENYRGTVAVDLVDSPLFPVLIGQVKSNEVLGRIVDELDLPGRWAKQEGRPSPLSSAEAIVRLRQECQVRFSKSPGFYISVKDPSAKDTASIANRLTAVLREAAGTKTDQQQSVLRIHSWAESGLISSLPDWSRTVPQGLVLGSALGLLAGLITSFGRVVFERPAVPVRC